jgi:probable phosphoglycerate mutase
VSGLPTGAPTARQLSVAMEADGGSRGNPGPAGWGWLVESGGKILAYGCDANRYATNNFAEYNGLISGLRAAAEVGATHVRVRMDSKLVIEQMSGRWKVKHADLLPLAATAKELAAAFADGVVFEWIPREEDSRADILANLAMDGRPPEGPMPVASVVTRVGEATMDPRKSVADMMAATAALAATYKLTGSPAERCDTVCAIAPDDLRAIWTTTPTPSWLAKQMTKTANPWFSERVWQT